jgi:hypothetical protein
MIVLESTDARVLSDTDPENLCVEYGPDMFFLSRSIVAKYGYAIGRGAGGEYLGVLKELPTTYIHSYACSGEIDLWFIDQYDCMFLMGCNEYSVELIRSALRLWKGGRLVMVGRDWENLIPMLPDLPGKECFYEEALDQDRLSELTDGKKPLYVNIGLPHEEAMDRYEQGIMTYDEVMSFLFLFSDQRNLGEENPDKKFFVVDGYYGKLGLFALFGKAVSVANYAKSRGFIPVIRILRSGHSFYSDFENDDIWSKFYNQPEGYTVEEVMHSKHVFFSPGFYNGSIQSNLMDHMSSQTTLSWPDGIYNSRVKAYLAEKEKMFLPYPDQTLGVLARGTDYVNTHLHNHTIHASKEMICEKIDEVLAERDDLSYIYLATEDAGYCAYFKERYGEKIYFTDQKRFTTKPGEMLAEHHRADAKKRDGFTMGVEYILSIYLLAKCNSLVASGGCAGVGVARKENGGRYRSVFIFDLGTNE